VFGAIALDVADLRQPGPLPPESQRTTSRRGTLAATRADRYPRTTAAAPVMASYISTEQYLWGLNRVLDGIHHHHYGQPESSDAGLPPCSRPPKASHQNHDTRRRPLPGGPEVIVV
jgi:hypothetical protein